MPSSTNRSRRFIISTLVGISVAGSLALIVLVFGSVSGVEFSPTHFETRTFSVREIPWLQIQISPIQRTSSQSSTSRYLIAQSLVKPTPGPPQQWHLVSLNRAGSNQFHADPKLLLDQLQLYVSSATQSTTNEYWHDWSINEPAKAKVFWPIIQRLANRELYILMPKLFALAVDSKDDSQLQVSIDDYLQESYVDLVNEMRDADRVDLANDLLNEALADYPTNATLQALR